MAVPSVCQRQIDAPIPLPEPSNSVPNGTGAKAPERDWIFNDGLAWLIKRSRLEERPCRTIIGKWLRDFGDDAVSAAMQQAEHENPFDPVSWIEKKFKPRETYEQRRIREGMEVINAYEAQRDSH
jgi:hypothetical protein